MCWKYGCSMRYKNGVPIVNWHLRNLLFVSNFMTWLVGFFMLAVGIYAKADKGLNSYNMTQLSVDPVKPILILGSVIFFVTFFGCVGALRENLCMLRFFSYALMLVLTLEMLTAFLAVLLSGTVRSHVEEMMYDSIKHYRDDLDLQDIVDWGQEEFKCCGVYEVSDWSNNIYFNCSESNPSMEKCGVPYSCCLPPKGGAVNTLCGMDIQAMNKFDITVVVYTNGCFDALVEWLEENMFLITCLIVTLCCIPQILGITISRILIIQIRDQDFYTKIGLLNPRGELDVDWF